MRKDPIMVGEPKIGRFLFDSITKGLYENPLCIFREYIQNSADAIDSAVQSSAMQRDSGKITIDIDPTPPEPKIVIEDNGCGIGSREAVAILSSVGESSKYDHRSRGFRGIGRLGGMAYCSRIVFHTKSQGESIETINSWDCKKMAEMLNPNNHKYRATELKDVIKECASFQSVTTKKKQADTFFRVELHKVKSARNVLLDILAAREYLTQVAPVPFDYQNFPFGKEIDNLLRREVLNYNTYKILVNFEELFKPYKTTVRLSQSKEDRITGIVPLETLDDDGKIIGRGWRADRKELLGAILRTERVEGIRVRVGNILLGDSDLLDRVFKQERFNSYFIGEIHAVDPELIPNSRRDDFEDSDLREIFYDNIRKTLGEPLSKLVQKTSSEHSKASPIKKASEAVVAAKKEQKTGFVSASHKNDVIKDLRDWKEQLEGLQRNKTNDSIKQGAQDQIERLEDAIEDIQKEKRDILTALSSLYSRVEREIVERVLAHIYENYAKASDAIKLSRILIQRLNADRKP